MWGRFRRTVFIFAVFLDTLKMNDKAKISPLKDDRETGKPTIANYTIQSIVTVFVFNYIFGFIAFYYTRMYTLIRGATRGRACRAYLPPNVIFISYMKS